MSQSGQREKDSIEQRASTSRDSLDRSSSSGSASSESLQTTAESMMSDASKRANLPDPSLPAPPLSEEDQGFTAQQLIQRQADLEEAAREAVPFSYTKGGCTYEKGYIRQPVYACRTCGGGGVCAGCSVGCHAEHDLVELFAKRHFRCDCGTLSLCRGKAELEAKLQPCNLRSKSLCFAPQNDENKYCKNFEGEFCRCERGKRYDAETEEETMLQCLECENWIHESCCSLRPSRLIHDIDAPKRELCDGPLVDPDAFDLFICDECVRKPENTTLRHYVGSRGWVACVPDDGSNILPAEIDGIPAVTVVARGDGWSSLWKVYGLKGGTTALLNADGDTHLRDTDDSATVAASLNLPSQQATKRKADEEGPATISAHELSHSKRQKTSNGLIVLDDFEEGEDAAKTDEESAKDAMAVQNLQDVSTNRKEACTFPTRPLFAGEGAALEPRLDVYLTTSFRERICRCDGCATDFAKFPYIADAEETYSPPCSETSSQAAAREAVAAGGDASSEGGQSQTSSTYDLGLAALNRLPRERMMESLEAYNRMRDALFAHLRPFADQGKVVDAESVREFFRQQRQQHQR